MNNREIISKLLGYVRYNYGVLQVATEKGWISLSEWNKNANQFSSFRLQSISKSEQTRLLRDYFYYTFYTSGSFDFISLPETKYVIDTLPNTFPNDRCKPVEEVYFQKLLFTGEAVVERGAARYIVQPGDFVLNNGLPGEVIKTFNQDPRTDQAESDHTNWLYSDSMQPGFNFEDQYIRFYFNSFPDQATSIARLLIDQLDSYGVQFQIKHLSADHEPDRCDRIVLFVPQKQFVVVASAVIHVYDICKPHLRDRLPLFVKPLFAGIGFAEEPFGRESFGESRCSWISLALLQWVSHLPAGSSGRPNANDITETILTLQGIGHLDHIYLNPGSYYPYNFEIFNIKPGIQERVPTRSNLWLRGAVKIANFLCREAAWITPEKCIWIGASRDNNSETFYAPLSGDWQNGLLGPVLFLIAIEKYVNDPLYKYVANRASPDFQYILAGDSVCNGASRDIFEYRPTIGADNVNRDIELEGERPGVSQVATNGADFKNDRDNYLCLQSFVMKTGNHQVMHPEKFYDILRYIQHNATAFATNEFGTNDLVPGMNGLSLVGFSYLLAYDPQFPRLPVEHAGKEYELIR